MVTKFRYLYGKLAGQVKANALLISSSHLALSTLINAGCGYLYWIIAARLFSLHNVGTGAALISIMLLIGTIAPFGLDAALVQVLLHTRESWGRVVYTFCLAITVIATVLTALFLMLGEIMDQAVAQARTSFLTALIFLATCVIWTLSLIVDQLFIVEKITSLVILRNLVTSLLKLGFLPVLLFFPENLISLSILGTWGLASLLSSSIGIAIFVKLKRNKLSWKFDLDLPQLFSMLPVSLGNYAIAMMVAVATQLLPVIVTQGLSAQYNAYFYIVWMIIQGVLLTIPSAMAQSFFAQTSNKNLPQIAARFWWLLRLMLLILVPLIGLIIAFRELVLGLFGSQYVVNGSNLLVMLSLGALPSSFNALYITMHRIRRDFRRCLIFTFGWLVVTTLSAVAGMLLLGLIGVGLGWTIGATIIAISELADLLLVFRSRITGLTTVKSIVH